MAEQYEIDEVLSIIRSHSSASNIQLAHLDNGIWKTSFNLKVQKPPRGYANGVLEDEPIVLLFQSAYPFKAPYIMLRADFSRDIPHVNPSLELKPNHVNPCVIDESLDGFMRHHGFGQVLYRLQKWLDDAAFDILAHNDRFWEPMRRDGLIWYLTANRERLLSLISKNAGHACLPTYTDKIPSNEDDFQLFGVVKKYARFTYKDIADYISSGKTQNAVTIFLWPDKTIADKYQPDNLIRADEIDHRARAYGCQSVQSAVSSLGSQLIRKGINRPVMVFVVFAARRLKPLPSYTNDANSNIEFIPYLGRMVCTSIPGRTDMIPHYELSKTLIPFGLRYDTTPELLMATSGTSFPYKERRIAVMGCGSVGSKIVMHLGKAGFGNFDLYDKSYLSPHNLARLGIVNQRHVCGITKSMAVKTELKMLSHDDVTEKCTDIVTLLANQDGLQLNDNASLLLDATASPVVHDALCRGKITPSDAVVSQTSFLAGGRLAYLAVEGGDRNPDIEDIKTSFWRCWAYADDAKHSIWPSENSLKNLRVGEGCESLTMIMSDMQASVASAGMAQIIYKAISQQDITGGMLSFGQLDEMQCGIQWQHHEIRPSLLIKTESTWEVRILSDLVGEIEQQVAEAGKNETGGYLVGRINWAIRRITLAAQLPPPSDSIFEQGRFILGTDGAREGLINFHEKSRRAFLAIGTWHSHPIGGIESTTDLRTLSDIAREFCGTPAVSLIWRPDGYKVLVKQSWLEE